MKFNTIVSSLILLSTSCYSEDVILRFTQNYPNKKFQNAFIEIKEPLVKLNQQQKDKVLKSIFLSKPSEQDALPTHVELGMNNVPVLNQGYHASCVSFSFIAALDALKGEGDYYSPLCFLNLGKHLEQYGYDSSGWNYSTNYIMLNRMRDFGLIPIKVQKTQGCGGLTEYPTYETDTSSAMLPEDYHRYSESIEQSGFDDFKIILQDSAYPNRIIKVIRQAINSGNRIVFTLAAPADEFNGIHGHYKSKQDAWVLSDDIVDKLKNQAVYADGFYGHDMVITGYDDHAIIKDIQGREHQGMFKVRNSWGETIGDHGDFYVSYDFMISLGMEWIEIIK